MIDNNVIFFKYILLLLVVKVVLLLLLSRVTFVFFMIDNNVIVISCFSGAVAGVSHVPNPITLSRHVMEKTPHCLMIGNGAHKFAKKQNIPMIEDPTTLITNFSILKSKYLKENEGPIDFNLMLKATMNTESLKNTKNPNAMKEFLTKQLKHDTVGAVAMDRHGNIACATSTGELTFCRNLCFCSFFFSLFNPTFSFIHFSFLSFFLCT